MNSVKNAFFVLLAGGTAVAGCAGKSNIIGRNDAVAQASCRVTIQVPNIGINSTRSYAIKGTWTRCGASGASWDMKRGNEWFGAWWFPPSPQYEYYWPGYDPQGKFSATPTGAYDGNYRYLPQNSKTFYIKLNSRVAFSGYRSGRNVFVRARVTRYNPKKNWGAGAWQNSVNRRVVFYDKAGGRWRWRGGRYTGGNGYTRYLRLGAPTRRQFRATVQQTATLWGRTSNANSR